MGRVLQSSSDIAATEDTIATVTNALLAGLQGTTVNAFPVRYNLSTVNAATSRTTLAFARDDLGVVNLTASAAAYDISDVALSLSGCSYFDTIFARTRTDLFPWYTAHTRRSRAVIVGMADCNGNSLDDAAGANVTLYIPLNAGVATANSECAIYNPATSTFETQGATFLGTDSSGAVGVCHVTRLGAVAVIAGTAPPPSPTPSPPPPEDDELSAVAIVFIVIGSIVFVALVLFAIIYYRRRDNVSDENSKGLFLSRTP
ncbi:unnamed protein product, partial [Symbiodinium sp. KB8]